MIALSLAIFGATDEASSKASDIPKGKSLMKVAIIMFVMIYLLVFTLVIITMKDFRNAPRGEQRIYLAVLGALPLLAVRLLYSILPAFSNNVDFSIFNGKPLVKLFMAIIEEFIIVCFYTWVGLIANPVQTRHHSRNAHHVLRLKDYSRREDNGRHRRHRRRKHHGRHYSSHHYSQREGQVWLEN
jgi:di/tricarboxylate transporter